MRPILLPLNLVEIQLLVGLEAIFEQGANVCFGLNVKTNTYNNLDGFYSNI